MDYFPTASSLQVFNPLHKKVKYQCRNYDVMITQVPPVHTLLRLNPTMWLSFSNQREAMMGHSRAISSSLLSKGPCSTHTHTQKDWINSVTPNTLHVSRQACQCLGMTSSLTRSTPKSCLVQTRDWRGVHWSSHWLAAMPSRVLMGSFSISLYFQNMVIRGVQGSRHRLKAFAWIPCLRRKVSRVFRSFGGAACLSVIRVPRVQACQEV